MCIPFGRSLEGIFYFSIFVIMAGRPTKYNPKDNQSVIDLMSEGGSIVEVAAMLDVDRQTIYNWMDSHVEFFDTIKKGMTLCQAWWEKEGRTNLYQSGMEGAYKFNSTLWIMNMKARFRDDWQEVNKNINENINKNIEISESEAKAIDKAIDEKY